MFKFKTHVSRWIRIWFQSNFQKQFPLQLCNTTNALICIIIIYIIYCTYNHIYNYIYRVLFQDCYLLFSTGSSRRCSEDWPTESPWLCKHGFDTKNPPQSTIIIVSAVIIHWPLPVKNHHPLSSSSIIIHHETIYQPFHGNFSKNGDTP